MSELTKSKKVKEEEKSIFYYAFINILAVS